MDDHNLKLAETAAYRSVVGAIRLLARLIMLYNLYNMSLCGLLRSQQWTRLL